MESPSTTKQVSVQTMIPRLPLFATSKHHWLSEQEERAVANDKHSRSGNEDEVWPSGRWNHVLPKTGIARNHWYSPSSSEVATQDTHLKKRLEEACKCTYTHALSKMHSQEYAYFLLHWSYRLATHFTTARRNDLTSGMSMLCLR